MFRANQFALYTLGGQVRRLSRLSLGTPLEEYRVVLLSVRKVVQTFVNNKTYQQFLPSSVKSANELLKSIQKELDLGDKRSGSISASQSSFDAVLRDELLRLPTYVVEQCGIFSSNDLIDHAENHFPDGIRKRLDNEIVTEFRESGKCLAFDAFTASGFHSLRAIEAIARGYHKVLTGEEAPDTLGPLINNLRKQLQQETQQKQADTELLELIIANLDRIRLIFRNPIMHPEMTLNKEEAMEVFDIAKNVISWMVRDADRRDPGKI